MESLSILIISFIVFLYCVFVLAKDDFLLLRKNVTLEQLFNASFLSFFAGLFTARIVFVLEHLKPDYLNPLVFFLFPYFPGLSVTGGIFGGTFLLWVYARRKKIPFTRVLDIFALSFFFSWTVGRIFEFILSWILTKTPHLLMLGGIAASFIIFLVFCLLFVTGKLKDGNTGYIGFAVFAVVDFFSRMLMRGPKSFALYSIEDILLIFLFLGFLALYIQQETLGGLYKNMRKK